VETRTYEEGQTNKQKFDPFPKRSDSLDWVERYWLMLVIANFILTSLAEIRCVRALFSRMLLIFISNLS
jgi:hypothetical protein